MMGRRSGAYGGTARPTYTQKRKQNLAYGGIAGLDGRKKYGIGSWFQEQIMDPVKDFIPNEIKDNPLLTAAIVGGGINQFGLPDWLVPDQIATGSNVGQNWIGNLINKDLVIGPGGEQPKVLSQLANTNQKNTALTKATDVLTGGGINPADPSTWEKTKQLLNDPTGALKKAALDQFSTLETKRMFPDDKTGILNTILTGAKAIPGKLET